MKRLPIIVTIIALVLNVMSASFSHACEQTNNDGTQVIKAVDDSSKVKVEGVSCMQSSCHHHCNTAFIAKNSDSQFSAISSTTYNLENSISYSQNIDSPSKPPKI
jgi:hypothetical protein